MSMKAKDYLDLPERIDNIVEIPMPPEIQKLMTPSRRNKFSA